MPVDPPPHGSSSTPRPRLWVPGLLYVSSEGELQAGAHVGYSDPSRAFRYTPLGPVRTLDDWTHRAWLVERAALRQRQVDDHAIILPETLVDREMQPHAWRWLAAQPLVCVSGLKVRQLVDAGLRVYSVACNAAGDGRLELTATGGAGPRVELSAPLSALRAAATSPADARPTLDQHADPSVIDRALRHLTDGAATEASVVQALAARCLVEDGYGYRGARAGEFRSVEAIARDARGLDTLFEQIFVRAEEQRDAAKAVRAALPTKPVEADRLELPTYGAARRVTAPPIHIAASSQAGGASVRMSIGAEQLADLELSQVDRWFVDDVADWSPTLPSTLEQEMAGARDARSSGAAKLVALFVLAAALVTAAAVLFSR